MPRSSPHSDPFHLADFLHIIRQRRALIATITALVILTTAVVTALLPRWYQSSTIIRVEKPEGQVALFQNQSSNYYDPFFVSDQFEIIQSEKILHRVIGKLGLTKVLAPDLGVPGPLPLDVTYRYITREMLKVESRRSTSLIEVRVFARDPAVAAAIANETARTYAEDRVALAVSDQDEGLAKLRQQLEEQEQTVARQRDAVEKLRNDLNISGIDFNARYTDMEVETLRQMQSSLITLRVEAIGRKTRWERFHAIPFEDRLAVVNSELVQDTNIQNLLQAWLLADQTVTRLRSRLGEAHPDLISAQDSQRKIREQLEVLLDGYDRSLEISYTEAQSRVTELEKQLDEARVEQILSARERMRPFEEAMARLDDETRLLTAMKLTLRQREIDLRVPKKTIEILNEAAPATHFSRPIWSLNILLACVLGLLLGTGSAVAVEYFDTSFRNVHDVETRLNIPVLGIIPRLQSPDEAAPDSTPADEPFRVLHANINLLPEGAAARVITIASAGPGEGKSTMIRRLARSMAEAGETVVLIDGDLRRPAQHRTFNRPRSPGLVDYLEGRSTAAQIVQSTPIARMHLIPAGTASAAGFTNEQSGRLRDLIKELQGRFQRILVDIPPIIGISDATVLASFADGIVLVIQHRRHPQSMVERARQIILSLKRPLLGAVLNQVPEGSGEDYHYYTSNYAYYRDGDHSAGRADKAAKIRREQPSEAAEKDRINLR